jgi:hypothetical protein
VSTSMPARRGELVRAPGGHDAALVDDDHPVADELDLGQQVGVEEDGDAAPAQLLQDLAHGPPAGGIQRARRLVRSSTCGEPTSDWAIPRRCCMPLDIASTGGRPPPPGRRGRAGRRARRRRRPIRPGADGGRGPPRRWPSREAEELGEVPEDRARRRRAGGEPATSTVPELGRTRPHAVLTRVLLPAPLGRAGRRARPRRRAGRPRAARSGARSA